MRSSARSSSDSLTSRWNHDDSLCLKDRIAASENRVLRLSLLRRVNPQAKRSGENPDAKRPPKNWAKSASDCLS
jgi:hypothetical protein